MLLHVLQCNWYSDIHFDLVKKFVSNLKLTPIDVCKGDATATRSRFF